MEEITDINGKNLFIKTMGNGDPLFFLHSSLLTSEMWNAQIKYFSKKYLTITYDFCGHEKSELPKENGSTGIFVIMEDWRAMINPQQGYSPEFRLLFVQETRRLVIVIAVGGFQRRPARFALVHFIWAAVVEVTARTLYVR